MISYFTLGYRDYKKNIDWNWLKKQNHIKKSKYVNIVSLNEPLVIQVDGTQGNGLIFVHKKINETMNEDEASGI